MPLLSEKELYNTEQVICDFIKPCGDGERLQKLLEQKAACTMNWVRNVFKLLKKKKKKRNR